MFNNIFEWKIKIIKIFTNIIFILKKTIIFEIKLYNIVYYNSQFKMIKKINKKSLSLTISGDPYGYGHFKRMIILKSKLKKNKFDNLIIDVSKLNIKSLNKIDLNTFNVIFIDFSNEIFFKKKKFNILINNLDSYKGKIFIFDSVEKKIVRFLLKNKKKRY